MTHEQAVKEVLEAVDALIKEVEKDATLDEDEARAMVDLEQAIADRFSELFDRYGIVIGDERID